MSADFDFPDKNPLGIMFAFEVGLVGLVGVCVCAILTACNAEL